MKKKYIIKVFSLTTCLIIAFSTVASAKSIKTTNSKSYIMSACIDPHPDEGGSKK